MLQKKKIPIACHSMNRSVPGYDGKDICDFVVNY